MAGISGKRERDKSQTENMQDSVQEQEYFAVFNVRAMLYV